MIYAGRKSTRDLCEVSATAILLPESDGHNESRFRVYLTSDVGLVGGGIFGFGLSAPFDCNVYLLDGGDELALVDTGIGGSVGNTERLIANLSDAGVDTSRIQHVFLTHYHADHAGGAAEIHDALNVIVHGSPLTAATLESGNEEQISLPAAKAAGLFPEDYTFQACPATGDLIEGARFAVGNLGIEIIETPGHCDGHVSLLVSGSETRYLVQGDVVFFGGEIFLQNVPDCSLQKYADSVSKLSTIEFDAFLPGHLGISLEDGQRHIRAAAEVFGNLLIPKSII